MKTRLLLGAVLLLLLYGCVGFYPARDDQPGQFQLPKATQPAQEIIKVRVESGMPYETPVCYYGRGSICPTPTPTPQGCMPYETPVCIPGRGAICQ